MEKIKTFSLFFLTRFTFLLYTLNQGGYILETKEFNIEEKYITKAKNYFGYLPEAHIYKFESWVEAREVEWINKRLEKHNFINEGGCFLTPNTIILIDKEAYYHEMAHLIIEGKLKDSLIEIKDERLRCMLFRFLFEVFAEYSATKILGKSMFIKDYERAKFNYEHNKSSAKRAELRKVIPYTIGAMLALGITDIHKHLKGIYAIVNENFELTNNSITIKDFNPLLKALLEDKYL